jgi:hypothetical protein
MIATLLLAVVERGARERVRLRSWNISSVPRDSGRVPASISRVPRSVSRVPGRISRVPTSISRVPGRISRVPTSISRVPRSISRVPASISRVPRSISRVRASNTTRVRVNTAGVRTRIRLFHERRPWRRDSPLHSLTGSSDVFSVTSRNSGLGQDRNGGS